MLRPKEAAAEIEELEREISLLSVACDFYYRSPDGQYDDIAGRCICLVADQLRDKIIEIKSQYPSGS